MTPLTPPPAVLPVTGTGQGGVGGAALGGAAATPQAPLQAGAVVQILAMVAGRNGAVVTLASADGPLRMGGAPDLPIGARVTLELPAARPEGGAGGPAVTGEAAARAAQPARLLAVDGRALQPPRPVTVAPLPPAAVTIEEARPGAPLSARITDAAGRVLREAVPVRLVIASGVPPERGTPVPPERAGMVTRTAEVAGRDALGRLMLRAGELGLRIEGTGLDLPTGAALRVLLPVGWDRPTPAADPLGRLVQALAALAARGADPASGPTATALLPRPDGSFVPRLLAFFQAVREGGTAPLARIGFEPAAGGAALDEALGELQRIGRQPLAEGWRAWVIPVAAEEERPGELRLFVHDDATGGGGEGEPPARRAVFELDLSRLGHLQLDLLLRGRRLDLRLRTERPLPDGLAPLLAKGLADAGAALGLDARLALAPGELLTLPEPSRPAPSDLSV